MLLTKPLFPALPAVSECLPGTPRPELELSPSSDRSSRGNHRRKESDPSVTTLQRLPQKQPQGSQGPLPALPEPERELS